VETEIEVGFEVLLTGEPRRVQVKVFIPKTEDALSIEHLLNLTYFIYFFLTFILSFFGFAEVLINFDIFIEIFLKIQFHKTQ